MHPTRTLALLALAAHACSDPLPGPPAGPATTEAAAAQTPIAMPIEVMPMDAGSLTGTFVEQRAFDLPAATATALIGGSLYLRGHALAYRDGSSMAQAKASVRIDGGAWVDLVNPPLPPVAGEIVIQGLDAIYGGIGGGFRTVRLLVPLTKLCGAPNCLGAGTHTIELQWGGTDGAGSGYRIVELNLRDANHVDHLPPNAFVVDDPVAWQPPLPGAADVAEGDRLWHERQLLITQPGGAPMVASCSDCHAHDGRDLEYYAFSNRSIVNRAIFHGLTPTEGQQLASYVRSHPSPRLGRPWNPPYQPGEGRDALGAAWWAAGAGLDAVQPETLARIDALFPDGRTDAQLMANNIRGDAVTPLPARTTNLRELPVQIQLPDWNSWLPEIHPVDLWGACAWDAGDGSFDGGLAVATGTLGGASSVVATDMDRDGRLDAALALPLANRLWVLRGEADGFGAATTVYMGTTPMAVATDDLTGDGVPDLAAANFDSDDVTVRAGNGVGGYGVMSTRVSGNGPRALVAGDWNGDGFTDLAVALFLADRIAIHLGNGTPLVGAPTPIGAGDGPTDIAAGDMDGDGDHDLVVVSSLTDQVLVFSGLGNGTFAAPTTLAVAARPQAVAIGDLDGDGWLDLAVASDLGAALTIVRRTSTGGYRAPAIIALAGPAADVALADPDEDGDLDPIVTVRGADAVVVKLNDGAGAFPAQSSLTIAGGPRALAVADFDLDGVLDVAAASSTLAQLTLASGTRCLDAAIAPSVVQAYQQARVDLDALDFGDPLAVASLPYVVGPVPSSGRTFLAGGWTLGNGASSDGTSYRTTRSLVLDAAVIRGHSMELVKRSLAQWLAIKQWELMHDYPLEVQGPTVFGADGEVLSWPIGGHQSVFQIAPHILAADRNAFADPATYDDEHDACRDPLYVAEPGCLSPQLHVAQTGLKGDYDSTAWYHLQVLLHAGARTLHESVDDTTAVQPVDWPYAMIHVHDVGDRAKDIASQIPGAPAPWEAARYLATMMKTYQMRDNDLGPAQHGWSMRDVSPRLLVSNWSGQAEKTQLLEQLDVVGGVGTRGTLANAFLLAFDDVVRSDPMNPTLFDTSLWPRFDPLTAGDIATWWQLDPIGHVAAAPIGTTEFPSGRFSHADGMWNALPLLRLIPGIDTARVDVLREWSAGMWPGPAAALNAWSTR